MSPLPMSRHPSRPIVAATLILLAVVTGVTGRAAAQRPPATGAYVSEVGGRVIAREAYRFGSDTLAAEVALVAQGLGLSSRTVVDGALVPSAFTVAVRRASGEAVIQQVEVTFADSARWSASGAGASQRGSTALVAPFTVLQNLQWSHLALALLRYDRARGGAQVLNVWLPAGARVIPMTMTVTGDSGTVQLAGVTMSVTLDPDGWLRAVRVPAQNLTVRWEAELEPLADAPREGNADTLPPAGVVESPYAIHSGALTLAGTLTLPRGATGPVPVALIVAGSGPTDRDGNSALGIRPNSYAQLAWRLAERGVASLRYDKRGLPGTQGHLDLTQTTFDDFVGDAVAAARALAADPRFGRVVIVGHSEGAGIALLASERGAPVAGVAMLSGIGRPFATVLREQLATQFDSTQMAAWDRGFARYLRGEDPGPLPAGMGMLVLPVNRRFMQTAVRYDPVASIRAARVPVLIVQGTTDLQVTVGDAQTLKAAKPDAQLVIIPEADHVFKHAAERTRGSQQAQYTDPTLPLVPELVDAIGRWVVALAPHP